MNRAGRAQLALLLEVAATPKPGNVDRRRDYPDLRFEHFLAGAVGARPGLEAAADGGPVGSAFERAVAGMSDQHGGNTQFGALLLVVPLVVAAAADELSVEGAAGIAETTSVDDAQAFYRAFDHVDVAIRDPPDGAEAFDVRRGGAAVDDLEAAEMTLAAVMELAADHDGVAREWVTGFERSFAVADRLQAETGPITDRAARAFLDQLAARPDTFVAVQHDRSTADRVRSRARAALDGEVDPETLAEEFVAAGINPGTTADIVAAGLFIALERGVVV